MSNARDYQARRGMMRVKRADGRVEYLHTLNGSGLATSRILPALVEQNQRADGSVVVLSGGFKKVCGLRGPEKVLKFPLRKPLFSARF